MTARYHLLSMAAPIPEQILPCSVPVTTRPDVGVVDLEGLSHAGRAQGAHGDFKAIRSGGEGEGA